MKLPVLPVLPPPLLDGTCCGVEEPSGRVMDVLAPHLLSLPLAGLMGLLREGPSPDLTQTGRSRAFPGRTTGPTHIPKAASHLAPRTGVDGDGWIPWRQMSPAGTGLSEAPGGEAKPSQVRAEADWSGAAWGLPCEAGSAHMARTGPSQFRLRVKVP